MALVSLWLRYISNPNTDSNFTSLENLLSWISIGRINACGIWPFSKLCHCIYCIKDTNKERLIWVLFFCWRNPVYATKSRDWIITSVINVFLNQLFLWCLGKIYMQKQAPLNCFCTWVFLLIIFLKIETDKACIVLQQDFTVLWWKRTENIFVSVMKE